MFKSRIPLQTPVLVKLLLFATLITFWVGWSTSSDASSQESILEISTFTKS